MSANNNQTGEQKPIDEVCKSFGQVDITQNLIDPMDEVCNRFNEVDIAEQPIDVVRKWFGLVDIAGNPIDDVCNQFDQVDLTQYPPSDTVNGTFEEVHHQLSALDRRRIATQFLDYLRNARAKSCDSGLTAACGLDGEPFSLPPHTELGRLSGGNPIQPCGTRQEFWDRVYMPPARLAICGGGALPAVLMEAWYESVRVTQRPQTAEEDGPSTATEPVPGPFLLTQLDVRPANIRIERGAFVGFVDLTHAGYFPDWWQSWVLEELRRNFEMAEITGSASEPQHLPAVRWAVALQAADDEDTRLNWAAVEGTVPVANEDEEIAAWERRQAGRLVDKGIFAFGSICSSTDWLAMRLEVPESEVKQVLAILKFVKHERE